MKLIIGWLYPDLMSTYGDRGNVMVLQKRCEWRRIEVKIEEIQLNTKYQILNTCDLLFMGGAQDRQQKIASDDLYNVKGPVIKKMVENGIPGLFICGAYQFLGNYYQPAEGEKIPGLGIFDLYTKHPGKEKERCIGNIVTEVSSLKFQGLKELVGFENHGGRTYLGELGDLPAGRQEVGELGKVIRGYGNNGEDKTEGCVYKNSIGTYLHGPILPKNPQLADWLIKTALEKKYQSKIELEKLDDELENKARQAMEKKILKNRS